MALVSARQSDYSGEVFTGETGARLRIEFYDGKTPARRADLSDADLKKLKIEDWTQEVVQRPTRQGARRIRL